MFRLNEFIMKGLLNAVGKMGDYQIILNAAGWYDKGVLNDEDMIMLQMAIDAQYMTEEEAVAGDVM